MENDKTLPIQSLSTPLSPVIPSPMIQVQSKASQLPLTILSIFSMIFLFGMAYFYFQIQSLKQQLVDKTSMVSTYDTTPTPTATKDPTATWKTYSIKELGITFKYPPNLQPMDYPNGLETSGQSGKQLCLVFIPLKTSFNLIKPAHAGGGPCQGIFAIGSTSTNYESGRGGGFGDLQGYTKTNDGYLANFVLGKQYPLLADLAQEITNKNDLKIIVIAGSNSTQFVERGSEPVQGTPGEGYMGALVNVTKAPYSGFNIQMQLTKELTKETFTQILSTFELIN